MNSLIENIRAALDTVGELTAIMLNALSLLCIIVGVVLAFTRSIQERRRTLDTYPLHTNFRMLFGGWLVVALEVQLAADIVSTIISPTNAHLIELGAIALIRTFLNYFLNKELHEEKEILDARREKTVPMLPK
jgi:uncharacterized membrane protein